MITGRAAQEAWDALLLWCSEVGSGTWKAFAAACAQLKLPPGRGARTLSALAHVEFDRAGGHFACAPVTLTTIPGMPGRLLLTGSRPGGLLEHLHQVAAVGGFSVDVAAEPAHQFGNGPGTAIVDADGPDAAPFAHAANIAFTPQAHRRIAALLAPADLQVVGQPATPDDRFAHWPVDADSLRDDFNADVPEGSEGLWRWRTWDRGRASYLRREGRWWLLPVAEYGPYLQTRPDGAPPPVNYDPTHRVLVVDGRAPLPPLHARAACLCSGRLPLDQPYAPGHWDEHYVNVEPDTAAAILTSLNVTE
ncbi:MAG: hypothetical protein M3P44_07775 [Actinomycetota bacterium]|nr:hypothetical protein [Actinomycetota bacterium]